MAKQISSLSIALGGNVAPWTSALATAGNAIGGLQARASSFAGTIAKWTGIGTIIGGLAGGAGLGLLIHQQSEAIDVNAKLTDRLGISSEALSGLQHAAGLSGVSTEALTGGLEKYLKNVAGAAGGNDKLAAGFTALGLSAADLVNLPTDQAMGKIGDALNAIENPAQRAAAAQAIFGKSGQSLLPFLAEGSKGIGELTAEAAALGLTFSRVDAAKVEEANDNITRAGSVITGAVRQITIAFAPFAAKAAASFTSFGIRAITAFKSIIGPVVSIAGRIISRVVSLVTTGGSMLWSAVTGAWSAIWGFVGPIVGAITSWVASNWQSILSTVVNVGVTIWGAVSSVFTGVWSLITSVSSIIATVWTSAMDLIGATTFGTGASVGGAFSTIGGWCAWLANAVNVAMVTASWAVSNWRGLIELHVVNVTYQIVKLGNQVGYIFGEVIPTWLTWLGQNWSGVLTDISSFTATVFTNMASNVSSFFQGVWGWLTGSGGGFQWTALTTGFEATLKELPKIAERNAGPLEQALGEQVKGLKGQLGASLSDALAKNRSATEGITSGITDAVGNAFKSTGADAIAGSPNPFANQPPTPFDLDTSAADGKLDKLRDKAQAGMKNITFGSAEQMQRIALASFSPSVAPVKTGGDKGQKTQENMLAELKNITTAIKDQEPVEVDEVDL